MEPPAPSLLAPPPPLHMEPPAPSLVPPPSPPCCMEGSHTHLVGGEPLPLHEVAWRCMEVRTQEQRFPLQECGAGGAAARQRGGTVMAGPCGGQGRQGGDHDAQRRGRRNMRGARKEER